MSKFFFSRILSDREYQLTEPWSGKVVDEVLKEKKSKNAVIGSLEAAEKHISAKIFKENLHTSLKILQICMDLQDSVQRSLQNPAEKSCRSAQIRKDRKPGGGRRTSSSVFLNRRPFVYYLPIASYGSIFAAKW